MWFWLVFLICIEEACNCWGSVNVKGCFWISLLWLVMEFVLFTRPNSLAVDGFCVLVDGKNGSSLMTWFWLQWCCCWCWCWCWCCCWCWCWCSSMWLQWSWIFLFLSAAEEGYDASSSWALKQADGILAHLFLFSTFFLLCDVDSFFQESALINNECFFKLFSIELFSEMTIEFSLCESKSLLIVSFDVTVRWLKLCELICVCILNCMLPQVFGFLEIWCEIPDFLFSRFFALFSCS